MISIVGMFKHRVRDPKIVETLEKYSVKEGKITQKIHEIQPSPFIPIKDCNQIK
jgi:hypothetical protein